MLRPVKDLEKFTINATDGEVWHFSGFLLDEQTRAIRYLIIDKSNWWLGRKV